MFKIKTRFYVLLAAVMSLLCGCSNTHDDVYADVQAQLTLQDIASKTNGVGAGAEMSVALSLYNICVTAKQYTPFIMVGSFLLGCIICGLFRREKTIRKWCVYVLMIGIPALAFICTYFLCFLYGCFNF